VVTADDVTATPGTEQFGGDHFIQGGQVNGTLVLGGEEQEWMPMELGRRLLRAS
jgi:hypothetical protein